MNTSIIKKIGVGLLCALAVALLAFAIDMTFAGSPRDQSAQTANPSASSTPATTASTSSSTDPSTLILGRWEMTDVDYEMRQSWGFVEAGSGDRMRVYTTVTATSSLHLSELHDWSIEKQDDQTILNEDLFGASDTDMPTDRYVIQTLTNDQLVLAATHDSDGTAVIDASATPMRFVRVKSAAEEISVSLEPTGSEKDALCAHVIEGTLADYPILLPITCPVSVGATGPVLDITITRDGAVEARRDGKLIFDQTSEEGAGTDILGLSSGPFLLNDSWDGAIKLEDVTYDGYKDLAIRSSSGAYNAAYDYYPFDPKKGTFASTSMLEATNPSVDAKTRTISSHDLGRGIGDIFSNKTYHFEDGAYKLVRDEEQDTLNYDSSFDGPHRHFIRDLKNGKWATTTDEIITIKE